MSGYNNLDFDEIEIIGNFFIHILNFFFILKNFLIILILWKIHFYLETYNINYLFMPQLNE